MSPFLPHIRFRHLPLVAVAAAAFAVPTAAQAASAPTVKIEVTDEAIAVTGAERLGRGPIRLHLSGDTLSGPRTVAVVELKPGVTARASLHKLEELQHLGRLVAGGNVSADADHVTTITARARQHLIVDVTSEQSASARFGVGSAASGARLPRTAATIGLRDLEHSALDGALALPRVSRAGVRPLEARMGARSAARPWTGSGSPSGRANDPRQARVRAQSSASRTPHGVAALTLASFASPRR